MGPTQRDSGVSDRRGSGVLPLLLPGATVTPDVLSEPGLSGDRPSEATSPPVPLTQLHIPRVVLFRPHLYHLHQAVSGIQRGPEHSKVLGFLGQGTGSTLSPDT